MTDERRSWLTELFRPRPDSPDRTVTTEADEAVPRPSLQEFWLLKLLLLSVEHMDWVAAHLNLDWVSHAIVRQAVSRRLESHGHHSWQGVAALISSLESEAARSLITEASTDERPIPNAQQQLKEWAGTLEAKVQERTRQLQHLAAHDPLTRLPNRRQFLVQLHETLACAAADGGLAGVFFLDLDHFKNVNDGMGHVFGDADSYMTKEEKAEAIANDPLPRFRQKLIDDGIASGDRPTCTGDLLSLPMRRDRGGIAEAVRRLDRAGVGIDDISVHRPTLDDVFIALTGHAAEHENGDRRDGDEPAAEQLTGERAA